ncbi:MAG: hypothetical protein DRJ64_01530 [Thermoprotei archaeon]|nr:MAG: hypothetical protein DRJ64_01530 [Thermoprotei archaeon]
MAWFAAVAPLIRLLIYAFIARGLFEQIANYFGQKRAAEATLEAAQAGTKRLEKELKLREESISRLEKQKRRMAMEELARLAAIQRRQAEAWLNAPSLLGEQARQQSEQQPNPNTLYLAILGELLGSGTPKGGV